MGRFDCASERENIQGHLEESRAGRQRSKLNMAGRLYGPGLSERGGRNKGERIEKVW